MTLSEYSHLREQVIKLFGQNEKHSQLLSDLKESYKANINSPRRYEQITSIGQLLRILEVRDVLSENNIQPFKSIALKLNDTRLLQKILEYEQSHVAEEYANQYTSEHKQFFQQQQPVKSYVNNNPNSTMSNVKIQRIKKTVIEDIGTYWRDLARSLNIKENMIDEIDDDYKKVQMKAKYMLDFYLEALSDPHTWFFDLCEALESCRRNDLAKKIKKVSLMNI